VKGTRAGRTSKVKRGTGKGGRRCRRLNSGHDGCPKHFSAVCFYEIYGSDVSSLFVEPVKLCRTIIGHLQDLYFSDNKEIIG
jgi:hypothetical protein